MSLCLSLLLGTAAAVDIPIIVYILNAEPEVLSISWAPDPLVLNQPFVVRATVRDNNTLADIRTAYAVIDGVNVTPTLENVQLGQADYVFSHTVTQSDDDIVDFSVHIGDEVVVFHYGYQVNIASRYSLTVLSRNLSVSMLPGGAKTVPLQIHVKCNVPVDLYAQVVGNVDLSLNGVKVLGTATKIGSFTTGTDADILLSATITAPTPMADQRYDYVLKLALAEQGKPPEGFTEVGVKVEKFPVTLVLIIVIAVLVVLVVLSRVNPKFGKS